MERVETQNRERYWQSNAQVEEAELIVADLEERLETWRDELEKRKRRLARCE
jgi:hypothetical protein